MEWGTSTSSLKDRRILPVHTRYIAADKLPGFWQKQKKKSREEKIENNQFTSSGPESESMARANDDYSIQHTTNDSPGCWRNVCIRATATQGAVQHVRSMVTLVLQHALLMKSHSSLLFSLDMGPKRAAHDWGRPQGLGLAHRSRGHCVGAARCRS